MALHPIVSHPFPRGRTAKGEEIFILTWRDLELFSQVQVKGEWYHTFCPIHGSNQERSLALLAATGFGHCFTCEARVFVADFNPQMARQVQQRRDHTAQVPSRSPIASRPKKHSSHDQPAEEWQLLAALCAQGDVSLDRDTAWNGQAYLEARRIPIALASRLGVAYVAPGTADQYGEWVRPWEERLLFPLITPNGEIGFTGRLITDWQRGRDAAAHQARLRASGRDPWRRTDRPGWFWEPSHLPSSDPVVVVEGPFDRLAVLAAGGFEPGEVVALAGTPFQPAWLSGVRTVLFALNQTTQGKKAGQLFKQHFAWDNDVRVEVCRMPARERNWSERWRREGANGLEFLYGDHALLAHGL